MQATEKKIKKILCGTSEIFAFIRFGIAWTGPDKSEIFLGFDIKVSKHLTFYASFMFSDRKGLKSVIFPLLVEK